MPTSVPPSPRSSTRSITTRAPSTAATVTFENRERRLPAHDLGYYHEYTVETPGEADRGARRVISGDHHELYYTRDHYKTFVEIRPPE